ncbi:hypothetical protein ACP4OV_009544 [Aristida adscensionis]
MKPTEIGTAGVHSFSSLLSQEQQHKKMGGSGVSSFNKLHCTEPGGSNKKRERQLPRLTMGEQGRASSNKIRDIVRLQQLLRKWKRLALAPKGGKGSSSNSHGVPKGFFAVCVGEEMKRFVIPTEYLGHWAFEGLLKEAEEEFGFEHKGALRIPCDVEVFEGILRLVGSKEAAAVCHGSSEHEILCI